MTDVLIPLREWWTRLEPSLRRIATAGLRSRDAQDVVQDIAVLMLRQPQKFSSYEALLHWATRTLHYRMLDARMEAVRRSIAFPDAWRAPTVPPSQEHFTYLKEIRARVDTLPVRQREALTGFLRGEATAAIAKRLGISEATVRSLQRLARLRLAAMFQEETEQ